MKYYVKVTETVAKAILQDGVPLTKTKDGNCLLYQSELNGVEGLNLTERANNLGGSLVPEVNALAEVNGTTDKPAHCYTPVEYGGDGEAEKPDGGYGETIENESTTENADIVDNNKEESEVNNE